MNITDIIMHSQCYIPDTTFLATLDHWTGVPQHHVWFASCLSAAPTTLPVCTGTYNSQSTLQLHQYT